MDYCGWIPTVTGHLSFNTIGLTSHPVKSKILRGDGSACVVQQRDLLDVVIPFLDGSRVGEFFREFIANKIIGVSGKFTFLCTTKPSTSTETMEGTIFLLANSKSTKVVRDINKRFSENAKSTESYDTAKDSLTKTCNANAIYSASFKLERNGKLTLTTDLSDDSDLDNQKIDYVVANQFYYFFKDIAHVHQHHDPNHDAIMELSVVSTTLPDQWISDTQHSLYRAVIRYKRFRNEKALFRASGILAYAQSFEASHANNANGTQKFNNSELESSLAVSRAEIQHFDQKQIGRIETVRNFFFALFGFVISATFVARLDPDIDIVPHPAMIASAKFVAANPFHVVGFAFILSVAFSFWTHRSDPANFSLVRTSLRWLQGFRMRWFMIFNITAAAVFGIFCYYFLFANLFK